MFHLHKTKSRKFLFNKKTKVESHLKVIYFKAKSFYNVLNYLIINNNDQRLQNIKASLLLLNALYVFCYPYTRQNSNITF